jgi:phosphoribosylanthranilate isomerase
LRRISHRIIHHGVTESQEKTGGICIRVKICGITTVADAKIAEDAGADAIGVIMFSDSPRAITPERAAEIFAALGPFIATVCVSTTRLKKELKTILALNPTAIQVYHDLPLSQRKRIRVIRALGNGVVPDSPCDALLIDESRGTGKKCDYQSARDVVSDISIPVILSGGLTPENVREAIAEVRPYAVDVSSGVEKKPGIKDPEKIYAFIKACKGIS